MIRRTLILMALVMLVATVAEAQSHSYFARGWQRANRWDLNINTRYTTEKTSEGEGGTSLKLEDDLGWGFSFGYNFSQHFNLGLAFAYRSINYTAKGFESAEPAGEPGEPVEYGGQLTTSNFGLNAEYNVLKGRFTPYVNGTLSWMHIDTNVFAGYSQGCWWDYWYGYVCGPVPTTYGTNTSAYSLGVGARYEFSDLVFLRIGYEHGWIDLNGHEGTDMFRFDFGLML